MKRAMWWVVVTFALLGAASGVARAVFVDDLVARVDPARDWAYQQLSITDPFVASRPELIRQVDSRFGDNRAITYTHVLLGAAFLMFGALQLSTRIRQRWLAYHRWAGRALVLTGGVMALAGMFFGVVIPIAGRAETFVISIVGTLFLFALVRGWIAIRARDRETHRVWMTRAFAIGLGITTVRLVAAVLDPLMTPLGFSVATTFVTSLWVGWGLTLLAAEWWLLAGALGRRSVLGAGQRQHEA